MSELDRGLPRILRIRLADNSTILVAITLRVEMIPRIIWTVERRAKVLQIVVLFQDVISPEALYSWKRSLTIDGFPAEIFRQRPFAFQTLLVVFSRASEINPGNIPM